MKRDVLLFMLALFLWAAVDAQETRFFMPREIKQAYKNGTRAYDGQPGANYWHNTVDYKIEVEVLPEEKLLKGSESVAYYNNSPDELNQLVIRLYHDAFRKANARAYRVSPDDITDGVGLKSLKIGGEEYDLGDRNSVRRQATNLVVNLDSPLKAGEQLSLEIDWEQYIPETTIRTGAYDATSFFIAYWYPQIAVYDDIFGWDRLAYDFGAEFYNNLGNYEVKITAPESFSVLSTGVLSNPDAVLPETILERYQKAKSSSETVSIVGAEDLEKGIAYKKASWEYKAEEVSDFAFCLSDHYCWDATSQQVEGKPVLIHSYYPVNMAESCKEVTANQQKMMKHFSEDVPGIPYPYPEFTTFIARGGGGMEYPMMANNGGPGLGVTIHEMFHTYFPMYVRTNEKRFAWMDEGWADFNTAVVQRRYFEGNDTPVYRSSSNSIQGVLGTISDLPLITSTQFMDMTNYGYASYPLPAFVYSMLHHHLGEEMFLKCYRTYIKRWAHKSPTPYDFFYTVEDVSGQQLDWFWNPWFFNYGSVDVAIKSFDEGKLQIENLGNRPVPVTVKVVYEDGTETEMVETIAVWKQSSQVEMQIPNSNAVKAIMVNMDIPDVDLVNNYHPSLEAIFSDVELPEYLFGTYQFNEFPATATIAMEDGIPKMKVPVAGIEFYLVPVEGNTYESLDGSMKVEFEVEDGQAKGFKAKTPDMEVSAYKL